MWRDRQFQVALFAGPLFWAAWSLIAGSSFEPWWPLRDPTRFLLPALVYPILEELAFRGLLQEWLYQKPWGARRSGIRQVRGPISLANWLTTFAFALFHLLYHAPLWAAAVIFPSLVFGYFRDRYQSVTPAIVLHVFYNAGYFWLFAA